MSLYGTEWRERGYVFSIHVKKIFKRGSPVSGSNSHETGEDGLFYTDPDPKLLKNVVPSYVNTVYFKTYLYISDTFHLIYKIENVEI